MSHHSGPENAQKFIQLSRVIAVMFATRQEWGKIMAVRDNWLLNMKKRRAGPAGESRNVRQRQ
jgi:hypothetical protein